MTLTEIYVIGAILANVIYLRRLRAFGHEIKELEADSSAIVDAIQGMSTNIQGPNN
jgi:hypothetical protein